jgi:hypothetical protein
MNSEWIGRVLEAVWHVVFGESWRMSPVDDDVLFPRVRGSKVVPYSGTDGGGGERSSPADGSGETVTRKKRRSKWGVLKPVTAVADGHGTQGVMQQQQQQQ